MIPRVESETSNLFVINSNGTLVRIRLSTDWPMSARGDVLAY